MMKEIRIIENSKSRKLVWKIILNEDLELSVSYITDALGDSVIVIRGEREDVDAFRDVYEMVK